MTSIEKLLNIMKDLRHPDKGCPWDLEQSFSSIAPYTIEEAYEVSEAIQRGDMAELQDELGDLLFQVVFHAQMAAEQGYFEFEDVVTSINNKMIRRHPHVFAGARVENARAQTDAWEKHKHAEREQKQSGESNHSQLDGIPFALPALTRAVKLQRRAARVGFDWTSIPPILEKIHEEIEELQLEINQQAQRERIEDEIGDVFFSVSNLARHLEIDPEAAIRRSNRKFEQRFKAIEDLAREQGRHLNDMTIEEMETLYQEIKQRENTEV